MVKKAPVEFSTREEKEPFLPHSPLHCRHPLPLFHIRLLNTRMVTGWIIGIKIITVTGVKLIIGSKVPCLFCFEICTPVGRGKEKGGSANFKTKHTEPLTQEMPSAMYVCRDRKAVRKQSGPRILLGEMCPIWGISSLFIDITQWGNGSYLVLGDSVRRQTIVHTGEHQLITWPPGRRLVRFEPSHNESEPQFDFFNWTCSMFNWYMVELSLFNCLMCNLIFTCGEAEQV